jgi:hypothetical protein
LHCHQRTFARFRSGLDVVVVALVVAVAVVCDGSDARRRNRLRARFVGDAVTMLAVAGGGAFVAVAGTASGESNGLLRVLT